MSSELEAAAGAAASGFVGRLASRHASPHGTPCANCATPLQGPWCHACGQAGEDFHRSTVRLIAEVFEGLLHVDGRLWRTLPDLMWRPGRLTRSYLDGHRAPQIPPLRLFLVVLLGIFVVGGLTNRTDPIQARTTTGDGVKVNVGATPASQSSVIDFNHITPEQRAKMSQRIASSDIRVHLPGVSEATASVWLKDRLQQVLTDPKRFELILEQWSERFAFMMLPVAALLMSVLYVFQRRFYLFDHTIFSLHSLSALGVVLTATMGLSTLVGDSASVLLLPMPVHLFAHMRGVYRSSVLGTLVRMALLFVGSAIAAALLVAGLVAVGLNSMDT